MITKIISGGQTGVDRAALDAAIELNISHGGWCPKGRLAELGATIPQKYQLNETTSSDDSERTKLNIRDSDGTLIIAPKLPLKVMDGTVLTIKEARETYKPHLIIDVQKYNNAYVIQKWIEGNNIKILNIAGPIESNSPGIYNLSLIVLKEMLSFNLINSR